jgi:hypothetical protein
VLCAGPAQGRNFPTLVGSSEGQAARGSEVSSFPVRYNLRGKSLSGKPPKADVTLAYLEERLTTGLGRDARIQELVDHCERQTDEETAAENEAALSRPGSAELVPHRPAPPRHLEDRK